MARGRFVGGRRGHFFWNIDFTPVRYIGSQCIQKDITLVLQSLDVVWGTRQSRASQVHEGLVSSDNVIPLEYPTYPLNNVIHYLKDLVENEFDAIPSLLSCSDNPSICFFSKVDEEFVAVFNCTNQPFLGFMICLVNPVDELLFQRRQYLHGR